MIDEDVAVKVENTSTQKMIKWMSVLIFIGLLITLILFSVFKKDFPVKWFFILGVPLVLLFLSVFFMFEIGNWLKKFKGNDKNKNIPSPIKLSQAYEIASNLLMTKKYADYIGKIIDEGTEEHGQQGNQSIYFIDCRGKYTNQNYFIALNMHYPETNYRIMINPNRYQKNNCLKRLAKDPEEPENKEIIERDFPILGGMERITKTFPNKKKKEAPKKEGDLI